MKPIKLKIGTYDFDTGVARGCTVVRHLEHTHVSLAGGFLTWSLRPFKNSKRFKNIGHGIYELKNKKSDLHAIVGPEPKTDYIYVLIEGGEAPMNLTEKQKESILTIKAQRGKCDVIICCCCPSVCDLATKAMESEDERVFHHRSIHGLYCSSSFRTYS